MSKAQKPNYISSDIKKVSEVDLKQVLKDISKKNQEFKDSFKIDRETLAFRTGK
ncbi:MAG: hypothetical protein U0U09_04525 [Cyclobacteriaceae bacterium]|jgi:hypothetical protein